MQISYEILQKIHKAIAIIESGVIDSLELGRHELIDDIYVNVMEYETKDSGKFEAHHVTIDIHYPIDGSEQIEIVDEKELEITDSYNEDGDYVLGNANGIRYQIKEKSYFVVMPGEAHLTGLKDGEAVKIKKAVIKVPIVILNGDRKVLNDSI